MEMLFPWTDPLPAKEQLRSPEWSVLGLTIDMIAAFASQPRHHTSCVLDGFCAACCKQHNTSILLQHLVCHLAIWRRNCRNNDAAIDAAANFRQLDAAAESNQLLPPLLVESRKLE